MPPASLPILGKESSTCSKSSGAHFKLCQSKGMPHLITLEDLYDLVWDLNLSKGKSGFWDHTCSSGTCFLQNES